MSRITVSDPAGPHAQKPRSRLKRSIRTEAISFLHYVGSKAAIVGMTRALARELGEWDIAVNTISPDYVPHDEDYAGRQPEMAAHIAAQRCFKHDQVPDDLVGTLLYLVGSGSDFVPGQNILVNGGRLFS